MYIVFNCSEIFCTQDVCPQNKLSIIKPGECCRSCVTPTCPVPTEPQCS